MPKHQYQERTQHNRPHLDPVRQEVDFEDHPNHLTSIQFSVAQFFIHQLGIR